MLKPLTINFQKETIMSRKQEIAKIAKEIKSIKRTLSAAGKGDLIEVHPNGKRKIWAENITRKEAEDLIFEMDENDGWSESDIFDLVFVPYNGGREMRFNEEYEWEKY